MQSPEYFKDENKTEIVSSPCLSSEIKVENFEYTEKPEDTYKDKKDELMSSSTETASEGEESLSSSWKSFKTNCNVKSHMIAHDDDADPYKYSICDEGLKTEQSFKFHMSSHEEDGKKLFHCANCDFKSRRTASIKRHQIIWHHDYIYKYRCYFCAMLFETKTIFLKHMEIHTVCNVCAEMCEDYYHLMQHMRKHDDQNDKNYNCECEDKYQVDAEKHHETKERKYKVEKIELERCSDENVDELNNDLNLFKEQILYFKCPQCKWRFRTTKSLKKHLKRHSLSFKCDYCDAVFKYKACFLKHIKYKHKNKY